MQTHHASVSELMHMPVLTIGPSARAHDVLALAQAQGVHHFPIVQHQKLLGLVCTCDLEELAPDAGVLQVAWRHVITLPHDGSSSDAARLMVARCRLDRDNRRRRRVRHRHSGGLDPRGSRAGSTTLGRALRLVRRAQSSPAGARWVVHLSGLPQQSPRLSRSTLVAS